MKKTIRLDSSFLARDRKMLAGAQPYPGFLVVNKKSDTKAEVFIYGDIGGWWDGITAEQFNKDLAALDVKEIDVWLNSGGGLINDGIAIYNGLARHQANVTIHIDGIAASIASVIAMAGDEIKIYEGARVMIHDPWSFAMGKADDMRREADVLDGFKGDILDLYEARTDKSRADIDNMMSEETWMSARQAVEHGFADMMVEAKKKTKAADSAMMKIYRNVPTDMMGLDSVSVRELEDTLRVRGGFSQTQAKNMASNAMNRISGKFQRDVEDLPQRDVGKEKQDFIETINKFF